MTRFSAWPALVIALALGSSGATATPNTQATNQISAIGNRRDFFPPWEGAGVYVFNPIRIDLNRGIQVFEPMSSHRIEDCSNEEFYCLTARRNNRYGLVHVVAPRRCIRRLAVGDQWQTGNVRTEVLAAIRSNDPLDPHRRRPDVIHFLGDDSNPKVVYEYWGAAGIVAIHYGLVDHPDLVAEVRNGLDPSTLPGQHRMALVTFDRFAACRFR